MLEVPSPPQHNPLLKIVNRRLDRRSIETMQTFISEEKKNTPGFSRQQPIKCLSGWIAHTLRANLVALALLTLLTGCATSSRTPAPSSPSAASTAPVSASYQGRFAVRYEDIERRTQNVYGHFVWREVGTTITLQLLNPLGQILAVLEVTPFDATLKLPNRPPQTATNIEDLMQEVLGFSLPISNLRAWLQPVPSPSLAQSNTLRKTDRHPTQFKQDGWTIDYVRATDRQTTQPLTQVRRINLSRDIPPTQIKLVIDP